MFQEIQECDQLRLPEKICEPDSRTYSFVRVDLATGQTRQRVIDDQYEAVACFTLNETVPNEVAIHFETAKNLYLYAWFVYRFYPVAEQQALACLEFALREKFSEYVADAKNKSKRGLEPGLKKLLGYAIKEGTVSNERFSTRERWAKDIAENRHHFQKIEEMMNAGIDCWVEDESEVEVTEEDRDCDWLKIFLQAIPSIRNDYAHGSRTLKSNVRHSFEVVSEIINQLYPRK